jgi:hypothetical protein
MAGGRFPCIHMEKLPAFGPKAERVKALLDGMLDGQLHTLPSPAFLDSDVKHGARSTSPIPAGSDRAVP